MADSYRIQLKASFTGRELIDEIRAIKRRAKDFRPVFKEIRKDLEELWSNNFLENGLPSGGWKPLDAEYGSWKAVHFPGRPPMIRSGELFRSLSDLRGTPNEIGLMRATFGTDIKYADFHQTGTKNMPARPVVFMTDRYERRWSTMARDYLSDGDT